MHMHSPEFGAAVQSRKNLSRIEQALFVERAFEPLLLIEIGFGKHYRHKIAFFHANTVLAGEHAADFNA